MPNAENGIIKYEAGQTLVSMVALTDSGDHYTMNSASTRWSNKSGYTPSVKPNGVATGGAVTPAISGTNDLVDTAALTCYLKGILTSVNASTDKTIARGSSKDYKKSSVTVNSAGAIAIVAGTEGDAFSTTRAAAGGPPLIPTTSIEIAQVHITSQVAAAITTDEIKQVPGTHMERYDFPAWTVNYIRVSERILGVAGITFLSTLPLSHTGPVIKQVFAEYYTPDMAEVPRAVDFKRPAESYSVNSTQVYGSTVGTESRSLAGGGFTVHLNDGISDNILNLEGANLWFDFYPDRLLAPYIATQGKLGIVESFPADNSIVATCTIAAAEAGVRIIG